MIRLVALVTLFWNLALPGSAQHIVADLSQSRVAITASFSGSDIVVFGAVRPEPGSIVEDPTMPVAAPLDVIVAVSGPRERVTVRKKDRRAGIWVNAEALDVDAAPTFYKVATSGPLDKILNESDDSRHRISIDHAIRSVGGAEQVGDTTPFIDALVRIRMEDGLYGIEENGVYLTEQTLFRSDIALPANLVEGEYTTRIFLTREGKVVAEYARALDVRKVGIERWIYTLAQEQALLYGLLSLAIAIIAGWGASAAFKYARGQS
ncbi:uncharacterized protein (TIGR02186 family) [Aliiruegeria haliotis]|uniref:Uncharacterized protein (TIGR02186 family) n=1 Tax=Aliiruegeria haliotis TaxID=1280846 RepID=A0A2T0RWL9_9RHOB|nr:TIGR02186 family protein [Aliiruegeria haliotis]PRY25571.1 uncharacterized protein (TIGR02186 family) [Aliiruegeria haliotis]